MITSFGRVSWPAVVKILLIFTVFTAGVLSTGVAIFLWPEAAVYFAMASALAMAAGVVVIELKTSRLPEPDTEAAEGPPKKRRNWLSGVSAAETRAELEDLRERYEAVKSEAALMTRISNASYVGLAHTDGDGNVVFANATLMRMLGVARIEDIETYHGRFEIVGESLTRFCDLLDVLRENIDSEVEFIFENGRSSQVYIGRASCVAPGEPSDPGETVFQFTNISARRKEDIRLRFYALHDPLTGAFNRITFWKHLEEAARDARPSRPVTLIALDLDKFKPVNDSYGHAAGDAVLKAVVARVKAVAGREASVYRTGGDEFALLLPDADVDALAPLAEEILLAIREPIRIPGGDVELDVSIGVSILPHDTAEPKSLIDCADAALYHVKRRGEGGFCFHSELERAPAEVRRPLALIAPPVPPGTSGFAQPAPDRREEPETAK